MNVIRGLLSASLLACPGDSPGSTRDAIISYAKQLNVANLDPALPRKRLDEWIQSTIAPGGTINWSEGCDLKGATAPEDPLCVGIRIKIDASRGVIAVLIVGTQGHGISGEPKFQSIVAGRTIYGADGFPTNIVWSRLSKKLSDLPVLIEAVTERTSF